MAKEKKSNISPVRLTDNTRYCLEPKAKQSQEESKQESSLGENKKDEFTPQPLPDKLIRAQGKSTAEQYSLIDSLNKRTVSELTDHDGNGILVWPHSFTTGNKDNIADMVVLECEKYGDQICRLQTGNLVGYVGNGKAQIDISTRFFPSSDGKQDYFLYYMLAKVFHANIVKLPVGSGSFRDMNLLIFMFPRLLIEALTQGMFKQYVRREYNDSRVRGTIDINRHIRINYPANGRIAYRTREFSYDNNITQLIRHTIEYMDTMPMGRALLCGTKEIEAARRMIVQVTPSYQKNQRRQVVADNRRPFTHPYFTRYKALQNLCLSILKNESISHGEMDKNVDGLLIDVAWLWEEYIAQVVAESGFKHHTSQDSFKLFKNSENDKRFQTVIPDYVLNQQGQQADAIADAKYIPLHRDDRLSADRASAVYYKTIMYMYRFATSKGFLFHPCQKAEVGHLPCTAEGVYHADYEICNGMDCHIHELGMIIPENENGYEQFCGTMREMEVKFRRMLFDLLNIGR